MNVFRERSGLEENSILQEFNNYRMLDIIKYAVSIMVICIHCNQLFSQEFLDFFIRNIVCRIAVPFFFITSAYFVRKGSGKNSQYVTGYLKKTMKSYMLWSLVFVPIGLDWIHQNLTLSANLLPFALLYGLIHIGTYYHLWYIPAIIVSIYFTDKLLRRVSYKWMFIISFLLFAFGSIETYYGLLPAGSFKDFFDMLLKIIFTTRSGLFYGMVFVFMGFFICDYQEKLKSIIKYIPTLAMLSAIILMIEGTLLYNVTRLDMNFLLGLIPFSFFFFLWILSFPYRPKKDTEKIRELSKYYYFVHPVCAVIIGQVGLAYDIDFLSSGLASFLLIVLLTHLLSTCIAEMQKPLPYLQIFFSALFGLLIAFVLCGIILPFKATDTVIKFEFVPCIWFFSSFLMCYVLYVKYKKG